MFAPQDVYHLCEPKLLMDLSHPDFHCLPEKGSSVLTAPRLCCSSSIRNCILYLDYLELMFKSKLLQYCCYPLSVPVVVHKPLKALSALAHPQTSWWQQLLSLWQLPSRRAGVWSIRHSLIQHRQGWGLRHDQTQGKAVTAWQCRVSLGLAGVMRTRIGSWRAANVLWHFRQQLKACEVPSEQHRHQPSSHRSQPALSPRGPSWLSGVTHPCSPGFSHITCSPPLPNFLFSLGPESRSLSLHFILVYLCFPGGNWKMKNSTK